MTYFVQRFSVMVFVLMLVRVMMFFACAMMFFVCGFFLDMLIDGHVKFVPRMPHFFTALRRLSRRQERVHDLHKLCLCLIRQQLVQSSRKHIARGAHAAV
jgi:hypothetical protein